MINDKEHYAGMKELIELTGDRYSELGIRSEELPCGVQESRDEKREELIELTVNNYSQPTTLPLRTYHLTTTNLLPYYYEPKEHQRNTKGTPKEGSYENSTILPAILQAASSHTLSFPSTPHGGA